MDIGQEAVSYLRVMYPAAHATLGPSGHTSLRNWLRTEIMAALDTMDADGIRARLESRREHRHILHRAWDDIRKRDEAAGVAARVSTSEAPAPSTTWASGTTATGTRTASGVGRAWFTAGGTSGPSRTSGRTTS